MDSNLRFAPDPEYQKSVYDGTVKSQTQESEKRLPTSTCGKGFRKLFGLNVLNMMLALLAAGFSSEKAQPFLAIQI